jgi:hypothetical protein
MKNITLAVALCLSLLTASVGAEESSRAAPSKSKVQTRESQAAMTPSEALARLTAGNARFVTNATKRRDWSVKVAATAAGQFPFAAVLGCMDSRAPVEIIFDQGIGDIFGVRVAGNVVNDDELGSLEYAVKVGTKLIVVLGHTGCGAVKGALDDVKFGNLTALLAKIRPAVAGGELQKFKGRGVCHEGGRAECAPVDEGDSREKPVPHEVYRRGESRAGWRHVRRRDGKGDLPGELSLRPAVVRFRGVAVAGPSSSRADPIAALRAPGVGSTSTSQPGAISRRRSSPWSSSTITRVKFTSRSVPIRPGARRRRVPGARCFAGEERIFDGSWHPRVLGPTAFSPSRAPAIRARAQRERAP